MDDDSTLVPYVVKTTRSGRKTKLPYDRDNQDHIWAKFLYEDSGPGTVCHAARGTEYVYVPRPAPVKVEQ